MKFFKVLAVKIDTLKGMILRSLTLQLVVLLSACGSGDFDPYLTLPFAKPTLSQGEVRYYNFELVANRTYEIGFEQKNCAAGTSCCMMLMSLNQTPSLTNHDYLLGSKTTNTPTLLIDSPVSATAILGIYAAKACSYTPPTILAESPSIETMDSGSGIGQLNVSYPQVDLSHTGGDYYLRDISRRGSMAGAPGNSNSGSMKDNATIETHGYVDFLSSSGAVATEPLKGPLTWDTGAQKKAVDAHAGSVIVYDYLLNQFNYNSYDNLGSEMNALIDLEFPLEPQTFCGTLVPAGSLYNAFWTGQGIAYTDAIKSFFSGITFYQTLSATLDVTAHEWAHGITDTHSNLVYEREPGALNEAFSDWMGAAVEHSVGETNWTIGEGISTSVGEIFFRDMQDPALYDDPDTYMGLNWQPTDVASCAVPDYCENDYCGVHTNSSVANKMFYLLSAGGTHNGVIVQGLGIQTAIKIAMDAQRHYWVSNTDFTSARSGMEAAAVGYGADAVIQVQLAWQAVGVN